MTYRRKTPVPSTGTKTTTDDNGLNRSARDLRELPPGSGLLNPKYWLIGIGVWALVAMFAWAAQAQDYIVVEGMGGGTIEWGQRENNDLIQQAFNENRPIRLEGRYTSAGTFLLDAVRTIPGSCVAPDSIFGFHEAQSLLAIFVMCAPFTDEEARQYHNRRIWLHYKEPLRSWFRMFVMGDTPSCRFHNLRGSQLENFGYPVCGE